MVTPVPATPLPFVKSQFFDNNGNKLNGGLLFAYAAGTSTKQATYTDATSGTQNTNPIVLDAFGRADVFLDPTLAPYKFVLSPSTDTDPPTGPLWSEDNIWPAFNGGAPFTLTAAAVNETSLTLASAATVNIGGAKANYIFISGVTTITAFDTVQSGVERTLEFQGALTLTYNATSLILPTKANILTVAGDVAKFRSEGSGNWRCVSYQRASGDPIIDGNVTLASAGTVNIGAASASYIFISGVTTITAFDTVAAGIERTLEFQGILTLTNNATSLILPGGQNIKTAAGDTAIFRSEGSGNWRCISYTKAAASPIWQNQVFTASGTFTTPANTNANTVFKFTVVGGGGGGGSSAVANNSGASGGGGGGTAIFYGSGVASGTAVTVTIGAAGSGGSAGGAGGNGGNSSIVFSGTTVTGGGGSGGTAGGTQVNGAAGGTATNGTINIVGGSTGSAGGVANASGYASAGGSSTMGGGGSGTGGGSGAAGGGFGAGGGGSSATGSGGAGTAGIVLVEWVQ